MSRFALAGRLLWSLFVVLAAGTRLPAQQPVALTDDTVREMLNVEDQLGGEHERLVELGPRLFPTYQRLLADPTVTPSEVARMFATIRVVKADRSQFLDHAVDALATRHAPLRRAALTLLIQIGGPREAAPVAVLLTDPDPTVPHHAARTLAAIGDRRALTAMDTWLNSAGEHADRELRESVARYRDELWRRLDREGREKKARAPGQPSTRP